MLQHKIARGEKGNEYNSILITLCVCNTARIKKLTSCTFSQPPEQRDKRQKKNGVRFNRNKT